MLTHLKIFGIRKVGSTVVVTPNGGGNAFRYHDLHRESNSVRDLLGKPEVGHLVINLSQMDYFGSEFIGSLVSMAREVRVHGGKAVICSANDQMKEVLRNMSIFKLWPYFETEQEALAELEVDSGT
jgi:anti-anti-sigma factor